MMLKTLALVSMLTVLTGIKPHQAFHTTHPAAEVAAINLSPSNPLVEKDPNGQYLNFDIVIKNISTHTLYLTTIEGTVMDASVKPVFKQSVNVNGQATGIKSIGSTLLKPGESIDVFNPFYTLAPNVKITFLQYEFFFDYADSPQQRENNKKRLATDFDASVKKIITPRAYIPKTNFDLPLKGKLIVLEKQPTKSALLRSNRYAFDLATADDNGNAFATDPFKKENWYVFGKPVFAPAGGIVVDFQNNVPDNEFNGKVVKAPIMPPEADPQHLGNYVIIDHGNGEFSLLQHLEQGSIMIRKGELIHAGQEIGKIGFSGDITSPHLHYAVMTSAKPSTAEGSPSYFNNYKLYRGKNYVEVKKGRIESGDIVQSDN